MREIFGMIALFCLLWVFTTTDIPAKSVTAAERWLDQVAAASDDPA